MTNPGSTNQIKLTPESASLVNAVAKRSGLPVGTIAANARVVSKHELADGAQLRSMDHPIGPVLCVENGFLRHVLGSSLRDLRLGVSVMYRNGVASNWTIVIRRYGDRLCELDYDDERVCEAERDNLRTLIDAWLSSGHTFEMETKALAIRKFNPANGQEI
jgi:hypothetical protein